MHILFALFLLILSILCAAPLARADSDPTPSPTPSIYSKEGYEEIDIDLPIVSDAAYNAVNQTYPWDNMPYKIINAQRSPWVQGQMKYYLVIELPARIYVRQCQITEYYIRHIPTYGLEWYVDKYGALSGCPGQKIINNWIG
mmetsp:Transcript_28422/g.52927  ORF Transcript_28422/g.52927 Transcript_28422/m.52927 type:complete len:142 (+) Transcript_28422:59-484(+)